MKPLAEMLAMEAADRRHALAPIRNVPWAEMTLQERRVELGVAHHTISLLGLLGIEAVVSNTEVLFRRRIAPRKAHPTVTMMAPAEQDAEEYTPIKVDG